MRPFGRIQLQSRTFFGLVEGDQVSELDGSPFDSYKANGGRYALSALKPLILRLTHNTSGSSRLFHISAAASHMMA